MRFRTALVGLVLVAALPFAMGKDKKNKKAMPAVFSTARYVYVEAEDGDAYKPGLLEEDRQAIADVQDALEAWHRYSLTANRNDADLVFVVRKGRLASGRLGGTVGTPTPGGPGPAGQSGPFPGQPRPMGPGAQAGGEAGPPDDYLEVKMRNPDNGLSAPIWARSQPDGLVGPRVPLVRILRDAVEKDYPQ